MRLFKIIAGLITGLGLATVVSMAQATPITNYLQNSGFETGDFTGWNVAGVNGGTGVLTDGESILGVTYGPLLPAVQNVRSGAYGAYGLTANANGEYVSLSQMLNLAAGNYTAGFYMGHDQSSLFGIANAITDGHLGIYMDGVLQPFNSSYSNNFFPGSTPGDFTLFDTSFSWAGGLLNIEYRFSGSGAERAGISVDDFFLTGAAPTSVPEPVTLWLFGLGIAGLGFVRRNKKS